jgi:hypothetical protein
MLLHCPRVQALFPQDRIRLEHDGPVWMHWTEHGGTLILKVGDLQFTELAGYEGESGLFLEVELTPGEDVVQEIEGFAAEHSLTLPPPASPPASECVIQPILAACHVPARKKFIFAEKSLLEARPGPAGSAVIAVKGEFRTCPVPCQEGDLVIHLTPGDLTRLLAHLRAWAK